MTKEDIAGVLENFGRLLELKGENPFKTRAYGIAIRALETLPEPLETLVAEKRLTEVEGIGEAIAEKIATLFETGRLPQYDELRESFPADILTLFELQGLGAKKIKALHDALGVSSISGLKRACKDGRVAGLPGFGAKSAENILAAIEHRKRNAGVFLLSDVAPIAERLLGDLRMHPEVLHAEAAGSYRRSKETVHDLDLIVSTREPKLVIEDFAGHELVDRVLAAGDTKASVVLKNGLQCDLRAVLGSEYPFALLYFTGNKEHNVRLRGRALEKGWSLNEYRFSEAEGRKLAEPLPEVRDEADIYRALGFAWMPPELREDRGELAASAQGKLPRLIELHNLRGTFHCHTNASDGRATLEEMAAAAQELGLQYLGIADHSKSSVQAHGLDAARLRAQRAEIDRLNAGFDAFRLFAGTECDILKDGSLDFPDEVLAALDYVVVSVHASFTLGEAEMTKRIIKAISNPYVTMLGHLTGRLLTTREPYKVDVPAVLEAAAETGTIIELNANPRRLDMDWRWWPLAKEKGVKCAINPDAHSTRGLQDLAFGVRLARKGWLERDDVVNCLPLGKIEAAIQKKRAGLA
jgi:DNA polymerase (family 10)